MTLRGFQGYMYRKLQKCRGWTEVVVEWEEYFLNMKVVGVLLTTAEPFPCFLKLGSFICVLVLFTNICLPLRRLDPLLLIEETLLLSEYTA